MSILKSTTGPNLGGMMVRTVSLLPLAAALLSVFLAAVASSGPRPRSATVRYFVGLNVLTALWSFAYFLALNLPGYDLLVAKFGTLLYALLIVQLVGAAGAPTYWFLFCASYARSAGRWTSGWRLALVYAPFAYTLVVVMTNPLTGLFASQAAPGAPVEYGPLALPHQIGTYALLATGTVLLVRSAWRRGTTTSRRQAVMLGLAACVPLLGGLAWSARHALGLPLQVNLAPVLFPILNLALGYELSRSGLAEIAPYSALQAFNAITDGALALDDEGVVVAINKVAQRLFPDLRLGMRLVESAPSLGEVAQTCLSTEAGYTGFDLELGGLLYWVRVRRTVDRRGVPDGCVVLLTDVTEMRATQARIVELSRALDEDAIILRNVSRSFERRERQG